MLFSYCGTPHPWRASVAHQVGGWSAPRDFWPGNFCWGIRKKEERKKGKRGEIEKEGKLYRGRWKIVNGSKMQVGKVIKRGELRFFCFVLFCFVFFLLFTFENDRNLWRKFVLGLPEWEFPTRNKHSHCEKIRKNDLTPSENYACYAPEGHMTVLNVFLYKESYL